MSDLNDILQDQVIHHSAVDLMKIEKGQRLKVLKMMKTLEKELVKDLIDFDPTAPKKTAVQIQRMKALLKQTRETIKTNISKTAKMLEKDLYDIASMESAWTGGAINAALGAQVASVAVSPSRLKALSRRTLIEGEYPAQWWKKQFVTLQDKFVREMRMGMNQSETIGQLSRRIRDKVMPGSKRSADALVRTSAATVIEEAKQESYRKVSDLIKGYKYVATLDGRTTPYCRAADGTIFNKGYKVVKGPKFVTPPPSHWNCRSTISPITKSWAELEKQYKGTSTMKKMDSVPTKTRAAMGGKAPIDTDYTTWLKNRSHSLQDKILGPTRANLFRDGKITNMTQLLDQDGDLLTLVKLKKAILSGTLIEPITGSLLLTSLSPQGVALAEAVKGGSKLSPKPTPAQLDEAKTVETKSELWANYNDPKQPVTFYKDTAVPKEHFKTIDKPDLSQKPIYEPEFKDVPGKKKSAGVVIYDQSTDKVWIFEPKDHFGGYEHSFPKGRIQKGLSAQQTAIQEVWEETGLQVELLDHLGDFEKTTTYSRYYVGRVIGGNPTQFGWEAQNVKIVPRKQLLKYLNVKVDKKIAVQFTAQRSWAKQAGVTDDIYVGFKEMNIDKKVLVAEKILKKEYDELVRTPAGKVALKELEDTESMWAMEFPDDKLVMLKNKIDEVVEEVNVEFNELVKELDAADLKIIYNELGGVSVFGKLPIASQSKAIKVIKPTLDKLKGLKKDLGTWWDDVLYMGTAKGDPEIFNNFPLKQKIVELKIVKIDYENRLQSIMIIVDDPDIDKKLKTLISKVTDGVKTEGGFAKLPIAHKVHILEDVVQKYEGDLFSEYTKLSSTGEGVSANLHIQYGLTKAEFTDLHTSVKLDKLKKQIKINKADDKKWLNFLVDEDNQSAVFKIQDEIGPDEWLSMPPGKQLEAVKKQLGIDQKSAKGIADELDDLIKNSDPEIIEMSSAFIELVKDEPTASSVASLKAMIKKDSKVLDKEFHVLRKKFKESSSPKEYDDMLQEWDDYGTWESDKMAQMDKWFVSHDADLKKTLNDAWAGIELDEYKSMMRGFGGPGKFDALSLSEKVQKLTEVSYAKSIKILDDLIEEKGGAKFLKKLGEDYEQEWWNTLPLGEKISFVKKAKKVGAPKPVAVHVKPKKKVVLGGLTPQEALDDILKNTDSEVLADVSDMVAIIETGPDVESIEMLYSMVAQSEKKLGIKSTTVFKPASKKIDIDLKKLKFPTQLEELATAHPTIVKDLKKTMDDSWDDLSDATKIQMIKDERKLVKVADDDLDFGDMDLDAFEDEMDLDDLLDEVGKEISEADIKKQVDLIQNKTHFKFDVEGSVVAKHRALMKEPEGKGIFNEFLDEVGDAKWEKYSVQKQYEAFDDMLEVMIEQKANAGTLDLTVVESIEDTLFKVMSSKEGGEAFIAVKKELGVDKWRKYTHGQKLTAIQDQLKKVEEGLAEVVKPGAKAKGKVVKVAPDPKKSYIYDDVDDLKTYVDVDHLDWGDDGGIMLGFGEFEIETPGGEGIFYGKMKKILSDYKYNQAVGDIPPDLQKQAYGYLTQDGKKIIDKEIVDLVDSPLTVQKPPSLTAGEIPDIPDFGETVLYEDIFELHDYLDTDVVELSEGGWAKVGGKVFDISDKDDLSGFLIEWDDLLTDYKKMKVHGKDPYIIQKQAYDYLTPKGKKIFDSEIADLLLDDLFPEVPTFPKTVPASKSSITQFYKKINEQVYFHGDPSLFPDEVKFGKKIYDLGESGDSAKFFSKMKIYLKLYKKNQITGKNFSATQKQAYNFLSKEGKEIFDADVADVVGTSQPKIVAPVKKTGLDFNDFEKYADRTGSNPGGFYNKKDNPGEKWYFKFLVSEDAVRNEVLAGKLYEKLGVDVPELVVVDKAGKKGVASRIIDGVKKDADKLASGKFVHDIEENFIVDAWMGDWDVVGMGFDNMVVKGNRVVRIDVGGSLRYRAQGGLKGTDFDKIVGEIESMRNGRNPYSSEVFKNVTHDQMVIGARKILSLSDSDIDDLVRTYGPKFKKSQDELIDILRKRKKYIAEQFPEALPHDIKTVKIKTGEFVTPEELKRIEDSRGNGFVLRSDEELIEDTEILFWEEKLNSASGDDLTAAMFKVRGEGQEIMEKFVKGNLSAISAVDESFDIAEVADEFLTAMRGISMQARKGVGLRSKDISRAIQAKKTYDMHLKELKKLVKDKKLLKSNLKIYEDKFADWNIHIDNVVKKSQGAKYDFPDKIYGGENLKARKPEWKVLLKQPKGKVKTKRILWNRKKGTFVKKETVKANLIRKEGEMIPLPRKTQGYEYFITKIGDVEIKYWDKDVDLALRGRVEMLVKGKPVTGVDDIYEVINKMGLNVARATPEYQEELYLIQLMYQQNKSSKFNKIMAGLEDIGSPAKRIEYLKTRYNGMIGRKVTDSPDYQPFGKYQAFGHGRRHSYRPDLETEAGWKSFSHTHTVYHQSYSDDIVASVLRMIDSGGQVAPTTDKFRRGFSWSGMSPKKDVSTGGGSYFFTRIRKKSYPVEKGYYWKTDVLKRVDSVSYYGDEFGRFTSLHRRKNTIKEFKHNATNPNRNETNFKNSLSVFDGLDKIVVGSRWEKMKLVEGIKERLKGDYWPDGRLIVDVIQIR